MLGRTSVAGIGDLPAPTQKKYGTSVNGLCSRPQWRKAGRATVTMKLFTRVILRGGVSLCDSLHDRERVAAFDNAGPLGTGEGTHEKS